MGMFDNIKCEYDLPLNDELKSLNIVWDHIVFQTKDLDNCLSNYRISQDGCLYEDIKEYERTFYTEEERKANNLRPWEFLKEEKIVKEYSDKKDFHGKITFYESISITEETDMWVDFDAYFIYGKIDKIVLAKTEKFTSRDIINQEISNKRKEQQRKLSYKIKVYTGYFFFFNFISRILYKIRRLIDKLYMFSIKNSY